MDLYTGPFLIVVILGISVIGISLALDVLWAQVLSLRSFYYVIRAPGVIVHECSHILGCIITGAKIKNVVFFSEKGGSVTYTSSKIPYVGDVVISTAPLVCIPLVLAGCTWVFSQYLGCVFPIMPVAVDSADTLWGLITAVTTLYIQNLIIRFNPWFLVYLYLTVTLVLSLAPSKQDMINAAVGISIIIIAGILILVSSIPSLVALLESITRLVGIGFTLGLMFEIIALVISSPLVLLYVYNRL
ncbi:MAG: metalloprotease family protein [Methanoregula sp.]|nr:metalloprotease family protein [Methanoregula sp.]